MARKNALPADSKFVSAKSSDRVTLHNTPFSAPVFSDMLRRERDRGTTEWDAAGFSFFFHGIDISKGNVM